MLATQAAHKSHAVSPTYHSERNKSGHPVTDSHLNIQIKSASLVTAKTGMVTRGQPAEVCTEEERSCNSRARSCACNGGFCWMAATSSRISNQSIIAINQQSSTATPPSSSRKLLLLLLLLRQCYCATGAFATLGTSPVASTSLPHQQRCVLHYRIVPSRFHCLPRSKATSVADSLMTAQRVPRWGGGGSRGESSHPRQPRFAHTAASHALHSSAPAYSCCETNHALARSRVLLAKPLTVPSRHRLRATVCCPLPPK